MKRLLAISCLIVLIIAVSVSGCTDLLATKKTSTPEATLKSYIFAYNRGDGDTIYDLLSSQAQSMTSRNAIKNDLESMSEFKVKYDSYDIISKDVSGNEATLDVVISASFEGQHLTTGVAKMVFVKEGNEWKLADIADRTGWL